MSPKETRTPDPSPVRRERATWISCIAWLLAAAHGAAAFDFFEPIQPPRAVQVMAHRGAATQAPENTKPALERCIEDQLEWAEIDVRLTKDGQHILSHGNTITDSSGKTWKINESTWEDLRALDVGANFAPRFAGVPLLSLKECFALGKGRLNFYLDGKAINPTQLAREVLEAGLERQVVVYADLGELRQIAVASAGKIATMTKWHPKSGGAEWAVSNRLAAVEVDAPEVTAKVVKAFHRAGVKVQVKVLGEWDCVAMWDRAIAAGADWLQTDRPEEIVAHALWKRLKQRPVQISYHRGASRYAPENTLPAFAKAVRMGADWVEFDVRATKDGAYFLLHDGRLNRTTEGDGPVSAITADAARRLHAGAKFGRPFAATPIPTMDEFLAQFAGKVGFYFDAKAITPEDLAGALVRHRVVDQTVVYQSPEFLAKLKAINPKIRALPPLGKPENLDALVASLKPYGVDADWNILSRELMARCHAAGVIVSSDALGDHEKIEDYQQAMDWGIDIIQTDYPLRVLRAIELRDSPRRR